MSEAWPKLFCQPNRVWLLDRWFRPESKRKIEKSETSAVHFLFQF
jgi:hypothetical protein